MDNSTLTIKIIQATGFESYKGTPDVYVILNCKEQKYETVVGKKN